jgi:ABC-type branched-subunit amino acid transport system substrate-binding protein
MREQRGVSRLLLAAAAVVVAGVVAACGSSSNSGSNSASNSLSNSSSKAGGSTAGSGAPIKIGVGVTVVPGVYDAQTMYAAGDKAALAYINAHGGWGGRKVELVTCISPGDPASDTACYRKFQSNGVIAVMGILANSGTVGVKLMTAARIPAFMVGGFGDDGSPWSNEVTGSVTSAYAVPARYACAKGYKRVSILYQDIATHTQALSSYAATTFKKCGISVNEVAVPETAADPSPYVAKATSTHPQLLVPVVPMPATTVVNAITTAGFPMSKVLMSPVLSQGFFSSPKSSGVMFESGWGIPVTQNSDSDVQTFLQYMRSDSPGTDPLTQLAVPAFQELTTIWQAAKAVGFSKVTGTAIHDYMLNEAAGRVRVLAGQPVTKVAGEPGVRQPWAQLYRWTGGKLVDLGWWYGYSACTSQQDCQKGSIAPRK